MTASQGLSWCKVMHTVLLQELCLSFPLICLPPTLQRFVVFSPSFGLRKDGISLSKSSSPPAQGHYRFRQCPLGGQIFLKRKRKATFLVLLFPPACNPWEGQPQSQKCSVALPILGAADTHGTLLAPSACVHQHMCAWWTHQGWVQTWHKQVMPDLLLFFNNSCWVFMISHLHFLSPLPQLMSLKIWEGLKSSNKTWYNFTHIVHWMK